MTLTIFQVQELAIMLHKVFTDMNIQHMKVLLADLMCAKRFNKTNQQDLNETQHKELINNIKESDCRIHNCLAQT